MNRHSSAAPVHQAGGAVVRMDRLEHPFGPSIAVYEALAAGGEPPAVDTLRAALAQHLGVHPRQLLLTNGVAEAQEAIVQWRRTTGPVVTFPPTSLPLADRARRDDVPVISILRRPRFSLDLDIDLASDLPPESWAYVASPNDPTGNLIDLPDAIRLARACAVLVIDERHGGYAGRSFIRLAQEFDNVLVLQTLETWAGLDAFPLSYVIGRPRLLEELARYRPRAEIAAGARIAAMATLRDLAQVRGNTQRIRHERSRLYRTLRKLNMVTPMPSWANFLLMRAERGSAALIADGLAERGVVVHRPPQPELWRYLRVSAGLPDHTDALKQALVDVGIEL